MSETNKIETFTDSQGVLYYAELNADSSTVLVEGELTKHEHEVLIVGVFVWEGKLLHEVVHRHHLPDGVQDEIEAWLLGLDNE